MEIIFEEYLIVYVIELFLHGLNFFCYIFSLIEKQEKSDVFIIL